MKYLIFALLLCGVIACGGRTPSPKTARSAAIGYFKGYGNKYPATPFGSKNLENVTINHIEEISYKLALIESYINFRDGHMGRSLLRMERKFPGGWRLVSWEMLDYR
jgi:hypothetical protein